MILRIFISCFLVNEVIICLILQLKKYVNIELIVLIILFHEIKINKYGNLQFFLFLLLFLIRNFFLTFGVESLFLLDSKVSFEVTVSYRVDKVSK